MSGGAQGQGAQAQPGAMNPQALAQGAQMGGTAGQSGSQGLPPQLLAMLAKMGQGQQAQANPMMGGAQGMQPRPQMQPQAGQMMQRPGMQGQPPQMSGAPGMQGGMQPGAQQGMQQMTPQMLSMLLAQKSGLMGQGGQGQ